MAIKKENHKTYMPVATCLICGCNDNNACLDPKTKIPCMWLWVNYEMEIGICSECIKFLSGIRIKQLNIKKILQRKVKR